MTAGPIRFKHLLWALTGITSVYVTYLVIVVGFRVAFPYDHLIWSESPFLTNMLRLHNGMPIYGTPADANSFVYSPGLEYVCFALLRPLGLHLDIRACRMVNVVIGLVAAGSATWFMVSVVREDVADVADSMRIPTVVFLAALSALVVANNFTFDVCHPDNLVALHLAGGIALARRAMLRKSLRAAIITAAVLGVGMLFKQTCALGGVGIAVYLFFWGRKHWGWRKAAPILVAIALSTTGCAYWLFVHHEHGPFWLLEVLSRHDRLYSRLGHLWAYDAAQIHRAPLWLGAVAVAMRGMFSEREERRETVGLWLFTGLFGAAPALLAYIKVFGLFNNLFVIDLWAALLVVPAFVESASALRNPSTDRSWAIAAASTLGVLTLGLYPTKRTPLDGHMRHGQQLQAALANDLAKNRNVLVAHGTAAWIRAGSTAVPRDRSNTLLELNAARKGVMTGTANRFAHGSYDRIYVNWPTYGAAIDNVLTEHYEVVDRIPGVQIPDATISGGWSLEMAPEIRIYTRSVKVPDAP